MSLRVGSQLIIYSHRPMNMAKLAGLAGRATSNISLDTEVEQPHYSIIC